MKRIRDIANNLLERYRDESTAEESLVGERDNGNISRPLLLTALVENVISQKRQEWKGSGCELHLLASSDKCSWLYIAPNEFKCMLSNLLNNAYESIKEQKKIDIKLGRNGGLLELKISDNGLGIDTDKIPLVLNGLSLKHSGKGFGLSEAKKYMERLGGKLQLFSKKNKGTDVILSFPYCESPGWFPEKITLMGSKCALILDDDLSMQDFWSDKLKDYEFSAQHLTKYDDAVDWCIRNPELLKNTVFLINYELMMDSKNGLSFLEYAGVKENCYLISGNAEEILIQKNAGLAGVWLIPKILVNDVPITRL